VTVYRLVSKATYEQQLFECASRKYGLDEAILGFGGGEGQQQHAAPQAARLLVNADVDAASHICYQCIERLPLLLCGTAL
jgi:hypothetical protein